MQQLIWLTIYITVSMSRIVDINDFHSEKLTDQFGTILEYFFEQHYCVHYISDSSEIERPIISSIIVKNFPVLHLNLTEGLKLSACNGYVMVSSTFQDVETTLLQQPENFMVHKNILIFFNGVGNFDTKAFKVLSKLHALPIYVVELKLTNDEYNVRVFDVYQQQYVPKLEYTKGTGGNGNVIKNWRPDFSLTDRKFKIAVFNCTPYVRISSNGTVLGGVEVKIIKHVTRDFRIEYVVHPNKFSSYKTTLLEVQNKFSDLSGCSKWLQYVDVSRSDMTTTYFQTCITFLVPKPNLLPDVTFIFQPIGYQLWLVNPVCMACVSVLLTLMARARNVGDHSWTSISSNALRVWSLTTLNGTPGFPKTARLRLVVTAWALFSVVTSTKYSAGFSSALTYPMHGARINSLQDMIDRDVPWGEEANSIAQLFRNVDSKVFGELSKRFRLEERAGDRERLVRTDNYAFLVKVLQGQRQHLVDARGLDEYGRTHLRVLPGCVGSCYFVFPLKKNSPFKSMFDGEIAKLTEHGFVDRWFAEVKSKTPHMERLYSSYVDPSNGRRVSFEFARFQGALYILIVGLLLSLVCFVFEVCYGRNKA